MTKVSVIMGIYNVGATLGEALDSIFSQTYQDFEIIMCDDASTDNTLSIANSYKSKYSDRIIILQNKENMGLNYTLNRCLDVVRGEYVARMDGDDICVPTRFEKQVEFLQNNSDYAIVSSPMIYFDEKGEYGTGKAVEYPEKKDFIVGSPFCHAPVMIRTEAYKKVGGYTINKRMLRVEDVNLWFKLYEAGYKGYNIQEPLYKMRDDRDAVSRRKFKYRLNSTYTRIVGFRRIKMPLRYYPYTLKPILVGLLPNFIYTYLHKNRMKV